MLIIKLLSTSKIYLMLLCSRYYNASISSLVNKFASFSFNVANPDS